MAAFFCFSRQGLFARSSRHRSSRFELEPSAGEMCRFGVFLGLVVRSGKLDIARYIGKMPDEHDKKILNAEGGARSG